MSRMEEGYALPRQVRLSVELRRSSVEAEVILGHRTSVRRKDLPRHLFP